MEEEEIGSGQRGGWGKVWEEKGRRNCFQDVKTNKQTKEDEWLEDSGRNRVVSSSVMSSS